MVSPVKRLTVVVVDDSAAMRGVLRAILKSEGYEVVGEAADGKSAVATVKRLRPHVVTLDVMMPGISGIEALPEILAASPETHVLMVSASDDRQTVKDAFDLGAIGYVTKPFNAERILRVFEQLSGLGRPQAPDAPAGTGAAVGGKRCVIVDDNRSIRLLLRSILEGEGLAVAAEAGDGMEGLEAIERERPDFVFLDVDMPALDGLNALLCLRAVHADLPVIMVTSHADRETVSRAAAHGASAYLLKPFEPAKVLAAVRRLLAA